MQLFFPVRVVFIIHRVNLVFCSTIRCVRASVPARAQLGQMVTVTAWCKGDPVPSDWLFNNKGGVGTRPTPISCARFNSTI